jgi:hypothetical protein
MRLAIDGNGNDAIESLMKKVADLGEFSNKDK